MTTGSQTGITVRLDTPIAYLDYGLIESVTIQTPIRAGMLLESGKHLGNPTLAMLRLIEGCCNLPVGTMEQATLSDLVRIFEALAPLIVPLDTIHNIVQGRVQS